MRRSLLEVVTPHAPHQHQQQPHAEQKTKSLWKRGLRMGLMSFEPPACCSHSACRRCGEAVLHSLYLGSHGVCWPTWIVALCIPTGWFSDLRLVCVQNESGAEAIKYHLTFIIMSSFSTEADSKITYAEGKKIVQQYLPVVNTVLDKGCQVGTAVSVVYPAVKPYAQGVCAASAATNVFVKKN
jgi:hypothetical protein